jgi:hypothetical protein
MLAATAYKPHKLALLRTLDAGLNHFEAIRTKAIADGEDEAEANRDAAQRALTFIAMFLQELDYESGSVGRVVADLAALEQGSKPSRMLMPRITPHRALDAPLIETIKGRLAAIMEYRQRELSRRDAAAWVLRHLPGAAQGKLKVNKPGTIDSWLTKWGGRYGTASVGRVALFGMRSLLEQLKPNEQGLKTVLVRLARSLPA